MKPIMITVSILLLLVGAVFAQEWQFETVISDGTAGLFNSLVLDDIGYPHISFLRFRDSIRCLDYTRWDGTAWQTEAADEQGTTLWENSLALDSSGYPHISYHYKSSITGGTLRYVRYDGTTWQKSLVESSGVAYVGNLNSMALDSSDYPHIAYSYGIGHNYCLKYAHWDGTTWRKEIVDSEGETGHYASLALDSSGYPHIAYRNYTDDSLKYAYWDGTDWQIETVDAEGDTGYQLSLALDSSDYPHISYCLMHTVYAGDLKYAHWDGTNWQIETVDAEGDTGSWTSLALDSSDYPHIAYCLYEPFYLPDSLKYAHWDGTNWQIETVDSEGTTGSGTNLALDSSDNPYISYVENTDWHLKFAYWNVPPPVFSLLSPSDGETVTDWPLCDWDDAPDYPSVSYDLWYSTDDTFGTHDEITDLAASEYQFSDTELDRDTTYYWKVVASDSHYETWSTETDWWFHVANDVGVETVDMLVQSKDEGLLLSWSITGDAPASCRILRQVGENEPTAVSGELAGSATSWLDASAEAGVEYAYYLEVTELDGTVSRFGPSEVIVPVAVSELALSDPYPNPADESLTIHYELTQNGSVELHIYDVAGRLVETLVSGEQTAGRHSVNWDSSVAATGVYLLRLEANGEAITKRAVISR